MSGRPYTTYFTSAWDRSEGQRGLGLDPSVRLRTKTKTDSNRTRPHSTARGALARVLALRSLARLPELGLLPDRQRDGARVQQLFDLTVGEIRLVGWPLSLQDVVPVVGLLRKPKMEDAMTSESRLRALNVVFVLSARPEVGDEAKYEQFPPYDRDALKAALRRAMLAKGDSGVARRRE